MPHITSLYLITFLLIVCHKMWQTLNRNGYAYHFVCVVDFSLFCKHCHDFVCVFTLISLILKYVSLNIQWKKYFICSAYCSRLGDTGVQSTGNKLILIPVLNPNFRLQNICSICPIALVIHPIQYFLMKIQMPKNSIVHKNNWQGKHYTSDYIQTYMCPYHNIFFGKWYDNDIISW